MTERERAVAEHRAAVDAFEDAQMDAGVDEDTMDEMAERVRTAFAAVAGFDADRRGTADTETSDRRDARRGTVETATGTVGFRRIGC